MLSRFTPIITALALLASCTKKEPEAKVDPEIQKEKDTTVKPVYPITGVKIAPLAHEFCDALLGMPNRREAECCSREQKTSLVPLCESTLSAALESGAVKLEERDVKTCAADLLRAHEGCDWVGPNPPPPPASCRGIIKGTVEDRKSCRSSLECKEGSQCFGVGPTQQGVCAPPGKKLTPCHLATDVLAGYTGQIDFEVQHPPCEGVCMRSICTDKKSLGEPCTLNVQCGEGNRCEESVCKKGVFQEGYPCTGFFCSKTLRCVEGRCRPPQGEGASCRNVFECKGTCFFMEKGKPGVCKKACEAAATGAAASATTTATGSSSRNLR